MKVGFSLPNGEKSKMINNTYDQEGDTKRQKLSNTSSISRQYAGFKNPRIVRVSQAFGGKDRHSKVLTVKGLRDRRIRLSLPTAIQLYYLQDRLGLSQPSKVIDWLIDSTKDDINKLPPLQIPPEDLNRFHIPPKFIPHQDFNSTQLSFSPFFNTPNYDHVTKGNHDQRMKGKEAMVESKWNSYNCNFESRSGDQLDTYASLMPSSLSPSSVPQFFLCPSGSTTPSFYPPYLMPNHFQLLSSSSPHVLSSLVPAPLNLIDSQERLPFGLNSNSKVSSENNNNG